MDLSVIIVSFNTKDLLRQCLRAVLASQTKYSFEVFVVDNASTDQSAEMVRAEFPGVKLIENQENIGYARGNNQAIKKILNSGGGGLIRYILFLNPDVEMAADTLDKMISFMEQNPETGIAGCKVLKEDGRLDLACRRSFPNPVNALWRLSGLSFLYPRSKYSSYNLTYASEDEIMEIDSVMGAFMMIRRETMEKIGVLDENFFMYGEDLDYCFRAKQAGFKVMYAPITSVVHHKGSASRKLPGKALLEFHRAMQIFYNKHHRERHNFLVNLLVAAGIWLRYAVKLLENSLRREKYVSK